MAIFIPSSGYTSDPGFIPGSGYVKSSTVDSTSSTFIPGVGYSSGYGYIPGGGYAEKGALTPLSGIFIPRWERFNRQPSGPVEIDWNNDLCANIVVAVYMPTFTDLITQTKTTNTGRYILREGAQGSGDLGPGGLSESVSVNGISSISDKRSYLLKYSLVNSSFNPRLLTTSPSESGEFISCETGNYTSFILRNSSNTGYLLKHMLPGPSTLSSVAVSTGLDAFTNGAPTALSASTLTSTTARSTAKIMIGNRSDFTRCWNGLLELIVAFNEELPRAALQSLSGNPYQILKPRRKYWTASAPVSNTAIRALPQQTRISQPQFPSKINWNNTITKGLVFAFNGGSGFVDLVSGNLLTITGTVSRSFSKYVGAYTSASTDVLSCTLSQQIPTTGGVSVLEIVDADAFDTLRKRSVRLSGATGTVLTREWFVNEDIASLQDSIGAFPTIRFPSYSAKTLYTNYIAHQTGDTHPTFYRNGQVATATTNFGTGTRKEPITSIYIGNHTSAMPLMGRSYLVLVFNRVLTQAERQSIEANPWQIFEPDRQFNVFYQQVTQLSAYQSKIYRSGVWASVPVKRYDGVQWVNIAARPSV